MNMYKYIWLLLVCLGMQDDIHAAGLMPIPKSRSESVPTKARAIAITPRAASDSATRKKNMEVRGRSFITEFLMKEERTPEDFAKMKAVAKRLEKDAFRRRAGVLAIGAADDSSDYSDEIGESSDTSPLPPLPPLFPDEDIKKVASTSHAIPIKLERSVDADDTTNFVQPDENKHESAERMARLNRSLAEFKKRRQYAKKVSSRVLVQEVAKHEAEAHSDSEDELLFPLELEDNKEEE